MNNSDITNSGPDNSKTPENQTPASGPFNVSQILVPTDFSQDSRKALDYALALATLFRSRVHCVHVYQMPYLGSELDWAIMARMEPELKAEAARKLDAFCAHLKGVEFDKVLLSGNAAHEICCYAKQTKVELVIIATHGTTGFKHFLLGSTTQKVVQLAPCPVLVVRSKEYDFIPTS